MRLAVKFGPDTGTGAAESKTEYTVCVFKVCVLFATCTCVVYSRRKIWNGISYHSLNLSLSDQYWGQAKSIPHYPVGVYGGIVVGI